MTERIVTGLESLPEQVVGCALAIGNFDGVHRGHQKIINTVRRLADSAGAKAVAMTFEPPPDLVLRPADRPQRISPPPFKYSLLLEAGCDYVVVAEATSNLLSMSPDEFVADVIVRRFRPRYVVEGHNFYFGRGRAGNVETLAEAGSRLGFEVHVVEPVMAGGGGRVSSTFVRELIARGDVAAAAECLGRSFILFGRVVTGHGRGRELDFPTANLLTGQQIIPADGVYAGMAKVCGKSYPAAISIGQNPTFGPAGRTVEAHLVGMSGNFCEESMELGFVARLRDQRRFAGPDELKQQIARDVKDVLRIVG